MRSPRGIEAVVLSVMLALAPAGHPSAQTPPEAPPGMVVFFLTTACPSGWTPASYAAGRLLVATSRGSEVRKSVGSPLRSKEDRVHAHSYSATISLPAKSISGASGCCNDQGAAKSDYQVSDVMDPGVTGLPFTQLVVCEKQ